MAVSDNGRRFGETQAFWTAFSWFAGLSVAQAPWAGGIADHALWLFGGFVALSLMVRALRWWRGRSFFWRPRRREVDGRFGEQAYWAAFSLLLGLATPSVLTVFDTSLAGVIATALLAVGVTVAILNAIRRRAVEPEWPPTRNPYPLLAPYTVEYADVYFGREDYVRQVAARVREGETIQERFIPVVGPSGTGKSSLVRAGVLPALRRWEFWPPSKWRRPRVLPPFAVGTDPYASLAQVLLDRTPAALDLATSMKATAQSAVDAVDRGEVPLGSPSLSRAIARRRHGSPRLVLALDQLEELATVEDQRLAFMSLLKCTLRDDPRLVVIATLRPDLFGPLVDGPAADLFSSQVVVRPMDRVELASVIEGPAHRAGVRLGPRVVPAILHDTAGADALPILSYLLHHLWDHAVADGVIELREYHNEMGGQTNAIARHAADAVSALSTVETPEAVLDALLQLVHHTGTEAYRRRVNLAELTQQQRSIIEHFAGPGVRLVAIAGEGTAEVSHEAVLRRWPALVKHIEDNVEPLRLRTRLEPIAAQWAHTRDPERLLSGADMREAERWPMLEQGLVGEYVAASLAADDAEAERRANVAAVHALLVVDPPRIARDVDLAMVIAHEAVQFRRTPPVGFALYRASAEGNRGVLRGHSRRLLAVAWSPDGTRLATGAEDNTARVWTDDGTLLLELTGHRGQVETVAWSPDGSHLATAANDRTARVWTADGTLLYELTDHIGHTAIAWSPDGTRLATTSVGGTARIGQGRFRPA